MRKKEKKEYNLWNKISTYTIPFGGTLVFITSLIAYVLFYSTYLGDSFSSVKLIGLVSMYLLLALATDDKAGVGDMLLQVWDIHQTKTLEDEEKMKLIRSYLESAVSEWCKYWRMFQELVNGGDPFKTKWQKFCLQMRQIKEGEINVLQAIWIYAYLAYTVIFSSGILKISEPIDLIISSGALLAILFTAGKIKGFNDFMAEIFKQLSYTDPIQIKGKLAVLEQYIIKGSQRYYFLDIKLEEEKNKNITIKKEETKQVEGNT